MDVHGAALPGIGVAPHLLQKLLPGEHLPPVRQQQPQLGGLCAAVAGVMLLLAALEQLADVREVFARLTGMAGIEEGYLNTLVKVLGVSYVAELAAQTCQDLGEGGLALKVGLVGKLCVFTLTAPMLLSLLEMILELTP